MAIKGRILSRFPARLVAGSGITLTKSNGVYTISLTAGLTSPFPSGVSLGDGTVSLPSLTFINDPDCGLYRIGSNNFGLSIGGTKILDFSSAGISGTGLREKLTAARSYYVRTDGSDSNDGRTNTSGGAFLTIQKAINTLRDSIDLAGNTVTVQVAAGTYTAGFQVDGPWQGNGVIYVTGAGATTIISTTSAICVAATRGASLVFDNMKLQTATSGNCVAADGCSRITIGSGVDFGACAGQHMECGGSATIFVGGDYTISGSAVGHMHMTGNGLIMVTSSTITLTGTPNFSAFFAGCNTGFILISNPTFVGSATGLRFFVHKNGAIDCPFSVDIDYLPGNVAGYTNSGGKYTSGLWFYKSHKSRNAAQPPLTSREVMEHYIGPDDLETVIQMHGFGGGPLSLRGTRSRGTGATPTALQAGDYMMNVTAAGHDGSAYTTHKAGMFSVAEGNWSGAATPAQWRFVITRLGSTTPVEAMVLGTAGLILDVDTPLYAQGNVGFYGTTPIAKQTGVAVTAAGIHAALVALGLISA